MNQINPRQALLALSVCALPFSSALAQVTAFTYQGRLNDTGKPASGIYDLRFALFDAAAAGNQIGAVVTNGVVSVSNGIFTVTVDFGASVFDGNARWLEIGARTNGEAAFTLLAPRSLLTPAPHAIYASSSAVSSVARNVADGGVTSAALAPGAVTSAAIAPGALTPNLLPANIAYLNGNPAFTGTVTAGNFVGSGAGLTNLKVANGSIGMAQLGPDVQFARAPYLTGVASSSPQKITCRISIDGQVTEPAATLGGSYTQGTTIVDSWGDPEKRDYNPLPGTWTRGKLVLRRRVTADPTWLNYRLDSWYTNNTIVRHTVILELWQGTALMARWTFAKGVVHQHNYRLASDGLPVEEITFQFETNPVRKLDPLDKVLPLNTGPQVGFGSDQSAGAIYGVRVDGTNWFDSAIVASDVSEASATQVSPTGSIGFVSTKPSPLILRQSPFAANDLWTWHNNFALTGTPTKRTVDVYLDKLLLQRGVSAWPFSYTFGFGDDGQPYEEYGIVYSLN